MVAEKRVQQSPTAECFVVLRGPTAGAPMSEAGLRALFRRHRAASGAIRVRPHRLRHTYGTELATARIDLLALREQMGHARPETTDGVAIVRSRIHAPANPPTSCSPNMAADWARPGSATGSSPRSRQQVCAVPPAGR